MDFYEELEENEGKLESPIIRDGEKIIVDTDRFEIKKVKTNKKMGRPPKIKDYTELSVKLEAYFKYCDEVKKPYTISGLCLFMGFGKSYFYDRLAKDPTALGDLLRKAHLKCENNIEEGGITGRYNAKSVEFVLKNNFEWNEKIKVETDSKNTVEFQWTLPSQMYKELKVVPAEVSDVVEKAYGKHLIEEPKKEEDNA